MEQSTACQLAHNLIFHQIYFSLATIDDDGKPWVVPLYYAYDQNYHFYFTSALLSRHTHNLLARPVVAATIFDTHKKWGTGNAVFLEGHASQVPEAETAQALDIIYAREHTLLAGRTKKGVEMYSGDSPRRVFKLEVNKCYVISDEGHPKYGKLVDVRMEVEL